MVEPSGTGSDTPQDVGEIDFRALFVHSTVPMLTIDVNARSILEVNRACEELLGLPAEEIVGQPGRSFLEDPSDDHVLRLRGLRGERLSTIATVRTVSGPRTVELNQVPAGPPGVLIVQSVDLTDLLDANVALEDRGVELQAKSAALESFAARVAHDLRSPLASIAGFADLLGRDDIDLGDEQRTEMLGRISANARSLATMIGELMEEAVGQLDDGDDADSIEALFASLRSILDGDLAASGARLRTTTEVETLPIPAALLRQPLLNLISNSIKYRDAERPLEVDVSIERSADLVEVRVHDNGRGLADDPETLFRSGQRGASASGTDGSGLGLPFARRAMRDIGGDLVVEEVSGPGACFCLRLPALQPEQKAPTVGGTLASGLRGAQLSAAFDVSPVPAVLVDLEHRRLLRVNQAAERLLGVPTDGIVGRAGREFLADPAVADELRRQLLQGPGTDPPRVLSTITTPSGPRQVELLAANVPDSTLALVQLIEQDGSAASD